MFSFSPWTDAYCWLSMSMGAKRITASESAENRLASVSAGRIKGAAAA